MSDCTWKEKMNSMFEISLWKNKFTSSVLDIYVIEKVNQASLGIRNKKREQPNWRSNNIGDAKKNVKQCNLTEKIINSNQHGDRKENEKK